MKEDDFEDVGFLDQQKLKKQEQKIESGRLPATRTTPKSVNLVVGNSYF